jgi:hypothetical protein
MNENDPDYMPPEVLANNLAFVSGDLNREIETLRAENVALRERAERAVEDLSQALADHIVMGASLANATQERDSLRERVAALERAGNAMAALHGPDCEDDYCVGCTHSRTWRALNPKGGG